MQAREDPLLEEVRRDVLYGVRSLRRSAGFTLVAVLTLALGIGASTAMFSVLHGVLLRELPVRDQDHLVGVWLEAAAGSNDHLPIPYRDLIAFREEHRAFESVAGVNFQGAVEVVMLDGGNPVTLAASWVTGDFFSVLGVVPVHGRTLRPPDDVPGAAPVMVISYTLWQRQFGGDPSAVGHALAWNGKTYTIVGVLPRGFEYPRRAEAWFAVIPWFPATVDPESKASPIQFDLVGRLRSEVSAQGARQDYQAFLQSGDRERPISERGQRPVVTPLPALITSGVSTILWTASAAVGLLLLIACINVTNLLLIRGSARAQELAIRIALGARRRRLVRQLLVESAVLGLLGGVLGVLLATAAVRVLVALAPASLPSRDAIGIDSRVQVFALAVTVIAVLLSGVVPAILSAGGDVNVWLRGGRSAARGNRRTQALRHGLVVGQVSLAFVVAIGAGLLARSLVALEDVNMGFNPDRLLVVATTIPPNLIPEHAGQVALEEEMLARIAAIPGVIDATTMEKPPFSALGGWFAPTYTGEGQAIEARTTNPSVNFEVVGSGYFRALEIPVVRGRPFGDQDREHAPRVAIISDAMARQTWPGQDPIGRRVALGSPDSDAEWLTVVGVVSGTRYHELTKPEPSLYIPARQFDGPVPMTVAVRTRGDPAQAIPQIRRALQQVHPALMLAGGGPMRQLLAGPLARPRFSTFLLATFAAITVLLALVGIYGALATTLSQRTREIGIRLALGAAVEEVRGLVLRQGMRLAVLGCALGLVGALVGMRVLRSMLFGVTPADPVTFVAVGGLVLGAAALACYLPARRATRVDLLVTLREE